MKGFLFLLIDCCGTVQNKCKHCAAQSAVCRQTEKQSDFWKYWIGMSPKNNKKVAKKPGKKSQNCLPLDQRLEIVRLRENG